MLTAAEIKSLIDADYSSDKKKLARIGRRYYEGKHDILGYKFYYLDKEGKLHEDTMRINIKKSHPFFKILVDQSVQYSLSNQEAFVRSDDPELQRWLDVYFNNNDRFRKQLSDILVGREVDGEAYAYAYKNKEGRTDFQYAQAGGVVEVRKTEADDGCEYVIYWYVDRIGKDNKKIKRIQVWDSKQVAFFSQVGDGQIMPDPSEAINPSPHILFRKDGDDALYYEEYGFIPFIRIDNNQKRKSSLTYVKGDIDDYDLMNCGLSNNIQETNESLYIVKGFNGNNLDELAFNLRNKRMLGLPGSKELDAGVEIKTIDIPVEARKTKMEIDEENIFRFGMGVNPNDLKDSGATVSVAIKAAYTLLELKAVNTEECLREFMSMLLDVVLDEINRENQTDYQRGDVYFDFSRETITNALENAQIELTKAQTRSTEVTTLLNIGTLLDNETLVQQICEQLEIDYEEIKDKLPKQEASDPYALAGRSALEAIIPEDDDQDGGGDLIE